MAMKQVGGFARTRFARALAGSCVGVVLFLKQPVCRSLSHRAPRAPPLPSSHLTCSGESVSTPLPVRIHTVYMRRTLQGGVSGNAHGRAIGVDEDVAHSSIRWVTPERSTPLSVHLRAFP